jgi:hypothetical protein
MRSSAVTFGHFKHLVETYKLAEQVRASIAADRKLKTAVAVENHTPIATFIPTAASAATARPSRKCSCPLTQTAVVNLRTSLTHGKNIFTQIIVISGDEISISVRGLF